MKSPDDAPAANDRILQLTPFWLKKILHGGKVCEVRGSKTRLGGTWLGHHGIVLGYASIEKVEEVNLEQLNEMQGMHKIPVMEELPYAKTYVWHLKNVVSVNRFHYLVKMGPVTWTKFVPVPST